MTIHFYSLNGLNQGETHLCIFQKCNLLTIKIRAEKVHDALMIGRCTEPKPEIVVLRLRIIDIALDRRLRDDTPDAALICPLVEGDKALPLGAMLFPFDERVDPSAEGKMTLRTARIFGIPLNALFVQKCEDFLPPDLSFERL